MNTPHFTKWQAQLDAALAAETPESIAQFLTEQPGRLQPFMENQHDLSDIQIRMLQQYARSEALEKVLIYVRSRETAIRAAEIVCGYDQNGLTGESALKHAIKIVEQDYDV